MPPVVSLTRSFAPVIPSTYLSLIGVNDTVAASQYSKSVEVSTAYPGDKLARHSGVVLSVSLHSSFSGTGSVKKPECMILVFNSDPMISAGAVSISYETRKYVRGVVPVFIEDWDFDAVAGTVTMPTQIPFEENSAKKVWVAIHINAAQPTINLAAGNDEFIDAVVMLKVES